MDWTSTNVWIVLEMHACDTGVMMVPGEAGINCQLPSQKGAWFCKMFVFDIPAVTDCQNENSIHLWIQELELNM